MNIYDDGDFFAAYSSMARSQDGLEAAGEWHQLRPLFPDLRKKRMLDLGCGYGWHSEYAAQIGAAYVLGIDASARMLEEARFNHAHGQIEYRHCRIEEYEFPPETFDFVFSNLALHYVESLEWVYRGIYRTLHQGGVFLFNIEHPAFTAGVRQEWVYNEAGEALYWPIDDYFIAGERETVFLGKSVKKHYHSPHGGVGGRNP
ncbi:MAG: class I SAM-dependent methyltransferase [Clostridia bacterium]|nr:class I SAM-dependent methyltransferase [Clostridia bacterium]